MNNTIAPIGHICSSIVDRETAPKMEDEGGVQASIIIDPEYADGLDGLQEGASLIILTWLHLAERKTLKVHPRGDMSRPARGVFSTRSPNRPNPIGMHEVTLVAKDGLKLTVEPLEALDGTPVVDIKPRKK